MTAQADVRRVFPGSNTPQGFYSYYQYLLEQDRANHIFVIKGGPGTGKSTFLKRLGNTMNSEGFNVEYHHCSADNNSLDGVVFPQLGIALLDGTAPHVTDPIHPGAIDEIINFGEFWDDAGIRAHRDQIVDVSARLSATFQRGFRYLKAARSIYGDIEIVHREAVHRGALNQMAATLVEELLSDRWVSHTPGRTRHLFGSAITPDGPRNHLDTLIGPMGRKVVIKGRPGTGKATLVEKVAAHAIERGYDVECFHCPFDPEKTQHILIPELDTGIVTSVAPHVWTGPADMLIDTDDALEERVVQRHDSRLARAQELYQTLFDTAIAALSEAKSLHDELEMYYIPYMDFDAIAPLYERVRDYILQVAGDSALR